MIITIDGPTASGKTTIARLLSRNLQCYYLSSGLLFRGLAYILVHKKEYQEKQLSNPNKNDIEQIILSDQLVYHYDSTHHEQLFFNGKDITPYLKEKDISQYSSILATNEWVRAALHQLQHRIATHHNLVVEGRDTGSVIFPDATVKFFLTASLEVRAKRWHADQNAKGKMISFDQAKDEIQKRDQRDSTRALAPLCIPEGAITIDATFLTEQEVLARMQQEIAQRIPHSSMISSSSSS